MSITKAQIKEWRKDPKGPRRVEKTDSWVGVPTPVELPPWEEEAQEIDLIDLLLDH